MAKPQAKQPYLDAGKHTVQVKSVELKLGDEASPKWATKSVKLMLGNDEGVTFWDIELEPLTFVDGNENKVSREIQAQQLANLVDDEVADDSNANFVRAVENLVMSGQMLNSTIDISIVEKVSKNVNPNTGKPYLNRNIYVNRLVEKGAVGEGVAALAEQFDAEPVAAGQDEVPW
jgi:hypothetical protein